MSGCTYSCKTSLIVWTGIVGILASIFVGTGEFLLHFTPSGYQSSQPYQFMLHISEQRLGYGHFFAVLFAPFYLVGFWHMYKMLEPAGGHLPLMTALIAGYGFIMGIVWIGSRSMIGEIVQFQGAMGSGDAVNTLIVVYQTHYETLLQIIRTTTLLMSMGFIYLVAKGKTFYPRWMWMFNPFFLLILVFLIYMVAPSVGIYIMPIAMNVAYFVFFSLSTCIAIKKTCVNDSKKSESSD